MSNKINNSNVTYNYVLGACKRRLEENEQLDKVRSAISPLDPAMCKPVEGKRIRSVVSATNNPVALYASSSISPIASSASIAESSSDNNITQKADENDLSVASSTETNITHLTLEDEGREFTDEYLEAILSQNNLLSSLSYSFTKFSQITRQGFDQFQTLTLLEELSLTGVQSIGPGQTEHLFKDLVLPISLTFLGLNDWYNLPIAGMGFLEPLVNLEELTLDNTDYVNDEDLAVLAKLPSLVRLTLVGEQAYTPEGLRNFLQQRPLVSLTIEEDLHFTDAYLESLKQGHSLKKLVIGRCPITQSALAGLLPRLPRLTLRH